MSTHNLGFRLWVFITVQWRGAKAVSKECWGPCHGLIPSLWDFAQNYSPQIEHRHQNWRGTIYSLDSEKAIEPRISLSWWTLDWVVALLVQVCAEICPVCQLGRPLFQPRTPWHDIKPLPEWKVDKVELKMATCVNIFQHSQHSCQLCGERQSLFRTASVVSTKVIFAGLPRKALEKAEYAEFSGPTCGNIAVWQLCRERQPVTVWKSRDGLNLTYLDQCHGVRFHGTSNSQGWRRRIAIQSTV